MQEKGFICPNCGRETGFPIFHHINLSLEPRFKKEILSHRLFDFACTCGFETEVLYSMVIHDMEKKYMIFLMTDTEEALPEGLEESLLPLKKEGYEFRRVQSIEEACEKINLWDHDLDDRVMELLKLATEHPFREEHQNENILRVSYEISEEGHPHLVFHSNNKAYSTILEEAQYDIAKKTLEKLPKSEKIIESIDKNWAKKMLMEPLY